MAASFCCALILVLIAILLPSTKAGATLTAVEHDKVTNGFRANKRVARRIAVITRRERGVSEEQQTCTGVVLSSTQILTCAHCFFGGSGPEAEGKRWFVYVGQQEMNTGKRYKVSSIASMKGYTLSDKRRDFAIVTTEKPFEKGTFRRAFLPRRKSVLEHLTLVETAGFGAVYLLGVGDPEDEGFLNQITLQFWNDSMCSERGTRAADYVSKREYVCAINPKFPEERGGACYGDSGGPLFTMDEKNRMTVHGLVSDGDWKCRGNMGFFPNTRKHSRSIRDFLKGDSDRWDMIL